MANSGGSKSERWADIADRETTTPLSGLGFSTSAPRQNRNGLSYNPDLVRKEFVSTIYFTASVNGSYGFEDPKSAFRWCLDMLKADLTPGERQISDTSSVASLSEPVNDIRDCPKAVHKIIDQFLSYLRTEDMGAPGLIRYVTYDNELVMIKYHWARGYIRNPKNIMSAGMREKRFSFLSPRMTRADGKFYEIELSIVCT
ncbi:TPA_asm: P7 [Picris trirhavirus 1]|nr:TPA_asm: P7 [Picris trirhavirus 1]